MEIIKYQTYQIFFSREEMEWMHNPIFVPIADKEVYLKTLNQIAFLEMKANEIQMAINAIKNPEPVKPKMTFEQALEIYQNNCVVHFHKMNDKEIEYYAIHHHMTEDQARDINEAEIKQARSDNRKRSSALRILNQVDPLLYPIIERSKGRMYHEYMIKDSDSKEDRLEKIHKNWMNFDMAIMDMNADLDLEECDFDFDPGITLDENISLAKNAWRDVNTYGDYN